MGKIDIQCKNNKSGIITIDTGKYTMPAALVNTIKLMLSIEDLTVAAYNRMASPVLKYDLERIIFNDDMNYGVFGEAQPWNGDVFISPRNIALTISKTWEHRKLVYDSYGVHATNWFLMTILHEALHCHLHRQFTAMGVQTGEPQGELDKKEEAAVRAKTDELYLEFVKKYGVELEATTFMGQLVTVELSNMNTENSRRVISCQLGWVDKSIVSIDRNGAMVLSVREDLRMRIVPNSSWGLPKHSLRSGIAEIFRDPNLGLETVPFRESRKPMVDEATVVVAPPPPEIIKEVTPVAPPPPVVTAVAPPPPPPQRVVAPPPPVVAHVAPVPPAPPLEVYEEDPEFLKAQAAFARMAGEVVASIEPTQVSLPVEPMPMPPQAVTPAYQEVMATPDAININEAVAAIAKELYDYIYINCGYSPEVGFTNPEAVLKSIPLPAGAPIVEYYAFDGMGRYTTKKFNGVVEGQVTSVAKLPCYDVMLHGKDGSLIRRRFLPQNVNKKKGSDFSYYARKARNNNTRVLWVMDPNISDSTVEALRAAGQQASKFVGKVENGVYQAF